MPEGREIMSSFLLHYFQVLRGNKYSFRPLEREHFCPWEEVGKVLPILARLSESLCGRAW